MEEALAKFSSVVRDPYKILDEWKERTGRKIIGCFPLYIPEEIIHAAGMLPVVMWESNEPVTVGHTLILPFNCGLSRSCVDDALKGKLNFIDGMVFYRPCLPAQDASFIIERRARPSFFEFIHLPALFKNSVVEALLIEELERLAASLEKYSGQRITAQSLNRSISIYNENRDLMRKLYELRRKKPGIIKAKEMVAIVHSSMLMPKEEHNKLLKELMPQLRKRQPPTDKRIRVVLSGSLCHAPRGDILDLIEELGMVVVDDDIYAGSRYFANDVKASENPIAALAERYLGRVPPCPTKGDWETFWSDYLLDIVQKNRAQGMISLMIKFCPPHLCHYPDIKRKFVEASVPEVLIELEHEVVSLEGVRTRLQSFVEVIRGGR